MKMFKTIAVSSVFAVAGVANAADTWHNLKVNVPFSFVVAGQNFDAGSYNVSEADSGIVVVRGEGKSAAVLSVPSGAPKIGETSSLRFTSSASREYLVGIEVEGSGSRTVPVRALQERNLTLSSK